MKADAQTNKLIAPFVTKIEVQKPEPTKVKVAAYVRVSSNSEDQENSFAAQLSYYANVFKTHGDWELVDIYADEGITGLKAENRVDFQRMLTDCRIGKIDRIITKSISRFSRNVTTTLSTVRELKSMGVTVHFEKENIDTASMSSEMMLTVFSIVAQNESLAISSNMQMGCRMRMKNGTFKQSTTPLGFRLENNKLVVDPYEAGIVRRIFSDYLAGKGITKIALELTAEGVTRNNGKSKWHHSGVNLVLKNERYIGDQLLQKKYTTETLPLQLKRNRGQKDMYYIENSHEAIISRSDFDAVQEMIEMRKKIHYSAAPPTSYPFSKIIKCSVCGQTFLRKNVNYINYWICSGMDRSSTCKVTQIAEEEIESAFIRMYNKLSRGKDQILAPIVTRLLELRSIKNKSSEKIIEINNQIREISEQSHVLNGLRAKGIIDSAFYISQQNELNAKMEKLRKSKSHFMIEDENDELITLTKTIITAIEDGPVLLEQFDESLFKILVSKITASSEDFIEIRLINGLCLTEQIERGKRR